MTTQWANIVLVVVCLGVCDVQSALPVSIPKCAPHDEICLKSDAMMVLQYLGQPNPDTKPPLPSLDPLPIDRIHVRPNPNTDVYFSQDYYDMRFCGMADANVTHFTTKVNATHVLLNFTLYMDLFEMLGWYRWNGTIMGHPIDGYGECNISSVDVSHTHMITLKRGRDDRLKLSQYKTDLKPSRLLFGLPNLVREDPEESKKMEQFFHDYSMPIFQAVKVDYDRVFGKIFYRYACAFFKGLKYIDLFLTDE